MDTEYINIVNALEDWQQEKKVRYVDISLQQIATICLEKNMANRDAIFMKRFLIGYTKIKSYQVNNAEKILLGLQQCLAIYTPKAYWQRVWFQEKKKEIEKEYPELNKINTNQIIVPSIHPTPAFEVLCEIVAEIWNTVPVAVKHPPKQIIIQEKIKQKLIEKGVADPSDNLVKQIDAVARPTNFKGKSK